MEEAKRGQNKKKSQQPITHQNTIIINIKCKYFTRNEKKINEIQLTKKMDLNN